MEKMYKKIKFSIQGLKFDIGVGSDPPIPNSMVTPLRKHVP